MTGSNLFWSLKTACKACSVVESPFITAPGIPYWNKKAMAEWGKTSEMLELKKGSSVAKKKNPSQI